MLDIAIRYKKDLENLFHGIWFDDKYKFWNCSSYYSSYTVDDNTWNRHQFVSIYDGRVIGYIGYSISRDDNTVHSLSILNFTEEKTTFGLDLGRALTDIFEKFNFHSLSFSVVIGNPVAKSYDKLTAKYGGRIVGIYKDFVKLVDGRYYDQKLYQISRDEYMNSKI